MDLFVVPTISFKLLYGLVVMSHDRRKILHPAQPSDTARKRPSPSHHHQHSTDNQTCNSLSFVLVQNIGQATGAGIGNGDDDRGGGKGENGGQGLEHGRLLWLQML
jgi:hypothetical protein